MSMLIIVLAFLAVIAPIPLFHLVLTPLVIQFEEHELVSRIVHP